MRYLSPENKSFRVYLVSLRRIDIWGTYIEVCCVHYFGYNSLLVPPWPTLSLLRYFDKLHLLHPDAELLLAEGLIKWSKPVINFCPDSKVTFTLHASIIKAKDKHITTSKLNSFLYSKHWNLL